MVTFAFSLTNEEKAYLKELVEWTLLYYFERGGNPAVKEVPAPPEGSRLASELGVFVTLNKDGQLRGCIGQIIGRGPLYQTVAQMAVAAAFNDPRFPPLHVDELEEISWEVSVMGPVTRCPDPNQVEVGKHGLFLQKGEHHGLLLPQVASERGWTRKIFLENLCRKAGLAPEDWKEPDAELYWFECVIVK